MQRHLGHHISLIPVSGIEPTFGNHPLCGKVNNYTRMYSINEINESGELGVEINSLEGKNYLQLLMVDLILCQPSGRVRTKFLAVAID